eukprot:COSAG02_NODE_27992_length_598_cov_1.759519_1_plen_39_part_10
MQTQANLSIFPRCKHRGLYDPRDMPLSLPPLLVSSIIGY